MQLETTILVEGLEFPEGPRWYQGKLWFSDMGNKLVMNVDLDGNVQTVARVPAEPSGLGWLPDGRLLVVDSRQDQTRSLLLSPQKALAYEAIADPGDLEKIGRRITQNRGKSLAEAELGQYLDEFVDADIAYEENGKYVSLALPRKTSFPSMEQRRQLYRA